MNYTYTVKVINKTTNQAVKELEVIGLRKALKLKRGLEINMHDNFYVTTTKND